MTCSVRWTEVNLKWLLIPKTNTIGVYKFTINYDSVKYKVHIFVVSHKDESRDLNNNQTNNPVHGYFRITMPN